MQRLIVMTRLRGTGKSCIAEAIGRELGMPVFAKDWLSVRVCAGNLTRPREQKVHAVSTVQSLPQDSPAAETKRI